MFPGWTAEQLFHPAAGEHDSIVQFAEIHAEILL
jgi:hypothetical protein